MLGLGKSGRSLGMGLAGLFSLAVVVSLLLGYRTRALDVPTVYFSSATYGVGEGGNKVTVTVNLSAASVDTVEVNFATSDGSAKVGEDDYAANSGKLTFLTSDTTETFDVFILEDDLDENNETVTLTLSNAINANLDGNNLATLTITDNDPLPTVDFSRSTYTVGEANGSKTIEVQLSPQSGRTVEVSYATSNGTAEAGKDYTAASAKLTFAPGETAKSFAVAILEDDLFEGDEDVTLTLSNPSNAILGNNPAALKIQDNDSSGIEVLPTTLTVSEPDEARSFNLSLVSEPSSGVTIGLSTSNAECSVSPSSIELTSANWSSGVDVTATATDDDIADGLQTCTVLTAPASSADGTYDGVDPSDVTVNVLDDDQAGVRVVPTQLDVTEGGAGDSYRIELTSQPTASVRVTVSTDSQISASPKQLDFNQSNWDQARSVAVSAVDDSLAEGPHSSTISHSVKSSDSQYAVLKPSNVVASIQDDDGAQIIVDPTELTISEPDGSSAFTISLTSKPTSDVTIALSPSNQQCSVSDSSAVLSSANWSSGASVTVTAVDDTLQDGDQLCEVVAGDAISEDPNFAGRQVQGVMVTVLDDGDRHVLLPFVVGGWPPLPGIPEVQPIDNSDGDGAYAVTWTTVPGADTYVLEEARESAFATAIEIYVGPSTTSDVSGQVTGRSYHRVKARNSWGDGAWSATQWADMLWEVEPNNQPADANGPLVSGVTYHGQFPSKESQFDYYYFDVGTAGQVELWLRDIPAGQDYNLVLRDASQQLVGYSAWGGNSNEYIGEAISPGRYYVQVWHYAGQGNSQPYDLRVLY